MSVGKIPLGVSGTKAVYVVKLNGDPVPTCDSPAEARVQMPNSVEWGVLNGHSLQLLERVISLLYLPLLGDDTAAPKSDSDSALSEEFLVGLRKFASHLRRTIQQVEGDVKLRLPALSPAVMEHVDKCVADVEIVKQVRLHAIFMSCDLTCAARGLARVVDADDCGRGVADAPQGAHRPRPAGRDRVLD